MTTPQDDIRTVDDAAPAVRDGHDAPRWMRVLERATTVMLLGGVGSLVFSFFTLGILPLGELQGETVRSTPAAYDPMTAKEEAGFEVYKREGCAYCHTTLVRDTESDVTRFGPPSEAWEYQDVYPQQWGTRRIGPDLSRESGVRTDDWQYAHLYDPRSTVPQSMMPSFRWLFEERVDGAGGGQLVPTEDAVSLVAFLNYLGRDIKEAGPQTQRGIDAVNGHYGGEHD